MRYLMPLLERFLLPDPAQPDPVKVRLHILQRLGVIGAWLPSLQVRRVSCGVNILYRCVWVYVCREISWLPSLQVRTGVI